MSQSTESPSAHTWIPSSFFCPLSNRLLTDPVIAADGQSYQRTDIQRRFSDGIITSPINGRALATQKLIPNYALSNAVREWEERVITCLPRRALPLEPISSYGCGCQEYYSSNIYFSGAPCEAPVRVLKVSSSRIQRSALDLVRIGRHPHLTRIRAICENGDEIQLATEAAPHGTLLDAIAKLRLQNPEGVSWRHRVSMLQQICTTLHFLELTCNIHDCLSFNNVHLFDFSESNPQRTLVKLSGYGCSPCHHEPSLYETWTRQSPSEECWDESARMWMFGVLAVQIIALKEIDWVRNDTDLAGSLERIWPSKLLTNNGPVGCPVPLWVNIKQCLREDPSQRPRFSELSHALMTIIGDGQTDLGDSQEMEITIKSLTGKFHFIKVRSDSSIFKVKEVIQFELRIDPAQQRLVYNGKVREDTRTLRSYDCQTGSVLFLILRLRCIASPHPASFGRYECISDGDFLMSDDSRKTTDKRNAARVVEKTGGSLKLLPYIGEGDTVLSKHYCNVLMKYLDGCARAMPNELDLKLTPSRYKLRELIGERSVQILEDFFGAPYDVIRVRRTVASDSWVPFHTDDSRRTMQVALTSEEDLDGGKLVFVTGEGFLEPSGQAGSATIHTSFIVHGVTKLRNGIRYSLFLCDLYGHYERKVISYITEATMQQLEFFERATKFLEDLEDRDISGYIQEYIRYILLGDQSQLPSLGVEIVWRTHLLSPLRYREFCETLPMRPASVGLMDHVPRDAQSYRDRDSMACSIQPALKIRMDLVSAVNKQKEFMKQVLSSSHITNSRTVAESVEEYYKFMRQVGDEKDTKLTPSLAVDFVWHTHLLFPKRYEEECHLIVGKFVDHEVTR